MPPAPERELARLYRGVAEKATAILRLARRRGVENVERFLVGQLRELGEQVAELDSVTASWIGENVGSQYVRSAGQAQATIPRGAVLSTAFGGVEARALAALEGRVSRDLRAVRTALATGLALNDPNRAGLTAVRRALEEDGLVQLDPLRGAVVRVPSGKLWRADAYARMLSRTAVADARRVAFRERYLANGIDVVRVVANGTEHPTCAVWEGRQLSLTGATPGLPTVADARAAGLFHPQCRHRYVVDTTVEQPPLLAAAEGRVPAPEPVRTTLGRAAPRRPQARPAVRAVRLAALAATRRRPRVPAPSV